MRTITISLAVLFTTVCCALLIPIGCGQGADMGVASGEKHGNCLDYPGNLGCPQASINNTICIINVCEEDGTCVPQTYPGHVCVVWSYFDAGVPDLVYGTCNDENVCCNDAGCAI